MCRISESCKHIYIFFTIFGNWHNESTVRHFATLNELNYNAQFLQTQYYFSTKHIKIGTISVFLTNVCFKVLMILKQLCNNYVIIFHSHLKLFCIHLNHSEKRYWYNETCKKEKWINWSEKQIFLKQTVSKCSGWLQCKPMEYSTFVINVQILEACKILWLNMICGLFKCKCYDIYL